MSTTLDIRYFRDALFVLIDKLLPFIEQKSVYSFCKILKSKIQDDQMTPYAIYLETQKINDNNTLHPEKLINTSEQRFNYSVLQKIKLAQIEFKNNSQQFASVFNSVKENVQSVYVSNEELQNMINEKEQISRASVREDKIRRVSIYKKNQQQPDGIARKQLEPMPDYHIDSKYQDQNNCKLPILPELKLKVKSDLKQYSLDDSRKEPTYNFEPKTNGYSNQKAQSSQQIPSNKYIQTIPSTPNSQKGITFQQHNSQTVSPISSFNYIQTSPQSFNNISQQQVQVNGFNNDQQFQHQQLNTQQYYPLTNLNETKPIQPPIGTYIPNYDLLARVDQLLQKSKNSILTQVNSICLSNRI